MRFIQTTLRAFAIAVSAICITGGSGLIATAHAQQSPNFNQDFAPSTETQQQTVESSRTVYSWIMNIAFYGVAIAGGLWYLFGGGTKAVYWAGGFLLFVGVTEVVGRYVFNVAGLTPPI